MASRLDMSVLELGGSNVAEDGRYDAIFMGIAQKEENICALIDTFFSFLNRRTDFFHVQKTGGEKLGFPSGFMETVVQKAATKHQTLYGRRQTALAKKPGTSGVTAKSNSTLKNTKSGSVATGLTVPSRSPERLKGKKSGEEEQTPASHSSKVIEIEDTKETSSSVSEDPKQVKAKPCSTGRSGVGHISTWNGAETEKYLWSQSLTELSMEIQLPEIVLADGGKRRATAKDLVVQISAAKLYVSCAGDVLVDGKLRFPVRLDGSYWNVEDNKQLLISLEKAQENWWKSVVEGDEEIDPTTIESTKHLDEYDEETQAHIRKMMKDQQLKQMGMKTPEEAEKEELLRRAWDAEGSPFKGQPFDPALINLEGDLPKTPSP